MDILKWIYEEVTRLRGINSPEAVPIHILLVKMALLHRESAPDVTASTELSLQIYERSSLYRKLREMYGENLLYFVNETGDEVVVGETDLKLASSGEKSVVKYVMLTPEGETKAGDRSGPD